MFLSTWALRRSPTPAICPRSSRCRSPTWSGIVALLTIQVVYVGITYGPIAAFLVELFPTSIRYTSMSLPYHLGLGWFGGFLPLIATATTTSAWAKETFGSNAIYTGFIYACGVCLMTAIIGTI